MYSYIIVVKEEIH